MSFRYRIGAYAGLLRHYGETFRYHWKNRKELQSGLFKEHEASLPLPFRFRKSRSRRSPVFWPKF